MTEKFVPRIHENGNVCCSNPKDLCAKCKEHFAAIAAKAGAKPNAVNPNLSPPLNPVPDPIPIPLGPRRFAAADIPDPPNPYDAGIEQMREQDQHITGTPDMDRRHRQDPNHPPNGYAIGIGIEKFKQQERDKEKENR